MSSKTYNQLKIYENTPLIETDRLILRALSEKDINDFFLILNDREVNTYLPWFPVETLDQAMNHLRKNYLDYYQLPSAYRYAICLKPDDRPIGYIVVSNSYSSDLGYGLRKEFWHNGFATEASLAVVERIKKAGYPYITATHDIKNPRSGLVMEKIGMNYRYSYVEQWQPKNIKVTFRMYQLNFEDKDTGVFMEYWNKYPEHFVENITLQQHTH